jgi:ABC-type lipoprotein export system ATPase subunit
MLVARNLKYTYKNGKSFNFPNVECESGKVILITGGSGKGKTTLLHLLGGLIKPTLGEVIVKNHVITSMKNKELDKFRGQNIGIIFQKMHFIASLSIMDNLLLSSWFGNGTKNKDKASFLLKRLHILELANKLPMQLSTGQLQRVAIARALMNDAALLLADEPTSNLDDENALLVATLLQDCAKEFKAALVIVTHDSRLKQIFNDNINIV